MKQVSESLKVAVIFIIVLLLSVLFLKSVKAAQYSEKDIRCMTEAIYFEARGEPVAGAIAVKKVILNRVADSRWADNVCDVVYQPKQFSYANTGILPKVDDWFEYDRAEYIARLVHEKDANFYGATHYFNPEVVNPSWSSNLTFIKRIGNHSFYK
jgi:spore germination cell wall hydrolase CwlJ-like protein